MEAAGGNIPLGPTVVSRFKKHSGRHCCRGSSVQRRFAAPATSHPSVVSIPLSMAMHQSRDRNIISIPDVH